MMKKVLLFLSVFISTLGFSQVQKPIQRIEKEGNKLYLIENNKRFEINKNVITVKFLNPNDTLKNIYKIIHIDRCGFVDLQVPENIDVDKYVKELKVSGAFESVEYNCYCKSCLYIDDTYWYHQHLYLDSIYIKDAWEITMGDPNIKVAVIDDGIDITHEDLGYCLDDGYSNVSMTLGTDFTSSNNAHLYPTTNHGTMVAGVIGAKTNNGKCIAGIAGGNHSQGVTLVPYCVSSSYHVRDAIYDAVNKGVKVINISKEMNQLSSIDNAIVYAYNHNVTIVCASGNDGTNSLSYPASHDKTIAVGACTGEGVRLEKSQYGTGLDLVAPSGDVRTTDLGGGYVDGGGTSLAAPHVTGTVALMLSIDSLLTPNQIKTILHNSCTKKHMYNFNSSGWNEEVGYGLLNVNEALINLFSITGPTTIYDSSEYSISNLPNTLNVNWSLAGANASCCTLQTNTPSANLCIVTLKDSVDFVNTNNLVLNAQIRHGYPVITTLTMPLTPVYIWGPTIPYSTSSYEIDNLPDNCTVSWNWSGTGLTVDNTPILLEPYYSTNNYFKLLRNNLDYARGTLTATINRSGNTVATISKTIDTGVNFSGTWYQGLNSPSTLTCGNTYAISGSQVVLQSDNFIGRTMTCSNNGMMLFGGVSHSGNTISFTPVLPTLKGDEPDAIPGFGNSITINVTDTTTHEAFKFTFYLEPQHPSNTPILNMAVSGNEYTFTIDEDSESRQAWTLEVVKIDTGQQVYSGTTDNASQTVTTSNWQSGIYAALVRKNGQIVATQKMTIK